MNSVVFNLLPMKRISLEVNEEIASKVVSPRTRAISKIEKSEGPKKPQEAKEQNGARWDLIQLVLVRYYINP